MGMVLEAKMLSRRRKSLSFLILGIALLIFSLTILKPEVSGPRRNDNMREKSLKTKMSLNRIQSRHLQKVQRGKDSRAQTKRDRTHFKNSKTSQTQEKKAALMNKNKTKSNQALLQVKITANSSQSLEKRFPNVIILGVKKAGTRALLEALQMHPNVVVAPKEVYYFNGFHPRGLEWYRQQMPLSLPNQITIEKSPTYFTSVEKTQVVNRMFVFSRSTPRILKLLVVVRDPTKRCLSEYTDLLARSIKGEIPAVNARFESLVLDKNGFVNANSSLVKTGLYIKHLNEWLKYFLPDELHFVSGEGLVNNPYKEIKAVENFLGLEPFFTKKNFKFVRQKKGFPCFISDSSNTGSPHCLPPNKGRKHVHVQPRTLQLLREFYRPYNKQFYQKVRRNFFWS